jgi:hypothetical protein
MEQITEITSQGRRNRNSTSNSNSVNSQPSPSTYGYHNTYHSHAQLHIGDPPSYACANDPRTLRVLEEKARTEAEAERNAPLPPPYSCSVELSGVLGLKQELVSPFRLSRDRDWNDVYIVLRGTQLCTYRVKHPGLLSKHRKPTAGRLLRTYTLQHAEVGVATDFKKTALVPKSPFAHLVPAHARPKLYESDPHLFEPVREHVIRLRLETEQFVICAPTQEVMLCWIENLCAAIDISAPLEDRSEPRYRSLPRRNRRQRDLDGNMSAAEAGRRIIAQQEQIIRELYPNLAAQDSNTNTNTSPESDDLDPEDVRFPTPTPTRADDDFSAPENRDCETQRKSALPPTPSAAQQLRYRRRCAPALLSASPRVSDIVMREGVRMRISVKEHALVEYNSHPPRYDAHAFPKRPVKETAVSEVVSERPGSPIRGMSDESITSISFGDGDGEVDLELGQSASRSEDDISASGPPSPTGISQIKNDAAAKIAEMGKVGTNVSVSAVALGVELLI